MRIVFIYPRFERLTQSHRVLGELAETGKSVGNFTMPPALGIPILAALTPPEHEIRVIDENIETIDDNLDADLIAVSFFTPQAEYAYAVADRFRAAGRTVIGGGMHVSLLPDDAAPHFDSLCIGEAETVWPQILADVAAGRLQKRYVGGYPDLSVMPLPRRDVLRNKAGYVWEATLVQVMRGCLFACENCILPIQCGKSFRFRPIGDVIREIESLRFREFFITDDSLVLPNRACLEYTRSLFEATATLSPKPRIFLSGSLNMKTDEEYLRLLAQGGVVSVYLVCGCDPFSVMAFQRAGRNRYFSWGLDIVKKLQDHGLRVFISYGLGFDFQDEYVFDATLEFTLKAGITTGEYYLLTPFPQTPAWCRFHAENRILHYQWTKYNTANVVFRPKNFTPESLLDGYLYCWREFYRLPCVDGRHSLFTPASETSHL